MTEDEKCMARELAKCTFLPGTGTKRFARDMAFAADSENSPELTAKQKAYLCSAVFRFRRQIPKLVVMLALRESANEAIKEK